MARTILGLVVCMLSILWCPLWVQGVLFVAAISLLRYRLLFLIPAIFADALYAPAHTMTFGHFKTTLIVGGLIVLWYIIVTQTRLSSYVQTT